MGDALVPLCTACMMGFAAMTASVASLRSTYLARESRRFSRAAFTGSKADVSSLFGPVVPAGGMLVCIEYRTPHRDCGVKDTPRAEEGLATDGVSIPGT